jgi:hypothetical protein
MSKSIARSCRRKCAACETKEAVRLLGQIEPGSQGHGSPILHVACTDGLDQHAQNLAPTVAMCGCMYMQGVLVHDKTL